MPILSLQNNSFNRQLISFLFFFIITGVIQAQRKTDEAELVKIIDQFKQGIEEKDSIRFMDLFLHDSIPWIGISHPASWTNYRKIHPDIKQINKSSCGSFIRFVVNFPSPIKEKFFNITTISDGVLATIAFDYSFWRNKEPYGWGKESWVLLKIEGKWKIAAVYYSGFDHKVTPIPQHFY